MRASIVAHSRYSMNIYYINEEKQLFVIDPKKPTRKKRARMYLWHSHTFHSIKLCCPTPLHMGSHSKAIPAPKHFFKPSPSLSFLIISQALNDLSQFPPKIKFNN
jgi:hypothetical protein